jgi:hypothetical protein
MPVCTEIVRKRRCPEPRVSVADEAQKLNAARRAGTKPAPGWAAVKHV